MNTVENHETKHSHQNSRCTVEISSSESNQQALDTNIDFPLQDKTPNARFLTDNAQHLIRERHGPTCLVLQEVESVIFVTTP